MSKRRLDRYCKPEHSELVYQYMLHRIDDIARVFRIPGFHRQRFHQAMAQLGTHKGAALQQALFELCSQYDKSEQSEFDAFKTRLRRYLYSKKNCTTIIVTRQTAEKFDAYKMENGMTSNDEALSSLISSLAISKL